MSKSSRPRLWREGDFRRLLTGQSISRVGTEVTFLALPTLAVLQLGAGPFQLGLLQAVQRLPFPVLALFAGVIVDRVPRRPLMIASDIGRAAVFASVPLLAVTGALRLWELYIVGLLSGVLAVAFDIAYLAYLPSVIRRDRLVEGNTLLQVSDSASTLFGPGLGGIAIQLVGAARAVLLDALSYMVSVVSLLRIRAREAPPAHATDERRVLQQIGEGLRFVFGNPVLRSLVLCLGSLVIGLHAVEAVQLIYFYNTLHVSPGALGLVLSLAGVGAIAGTWLAGRQFRRLGLGNTLALDYLLSGVLSAALLLGTVLPPIPLLAVLFFINGLLNTVCEIGQLSLRQALTPARLQGRMNATFRMVFWGAWPLANLLGGVSGALFGVPQTIAIGAACGMAAALVIPFTPLRAVRAVPAAVAEQALPAGG